MTPALLPSGAPAAIQCQDRDGNGDTERAIAGVASDTTSVGEEEAAVKARLEEWAYSAVVKDSSLADNDTTIAGFVADAAGTNLEGTVTATESLGEQDTTVSLVQAQGIVPSALIEENHRAVLLIRQSGTLLDSAELSQLEQIANQCQRLGGRAVNIARSILAAEGRLIWEDPGCSGMKQAGREQKGIQQLLLSRPAGPIRRVPRFSCTWRTRRPMA